jgi:structure-specific endonuclease subunit SLX1
MSQSWFCYCLESETKTTYIGSTIDPDRRLRQHNRELVGGAKATGRSKGWKRICCVTGFPDERAALQFEWKWKHISKNLQGKPLEKRLKALELLLNSEQSTSSSQQFSTYDGPLCLFVEDDSCSELRTKDFKYAIVQ